MTRIALFLLAVLAGLGLLVWAARDLPPPSSVRFAAGIENGGYWRIAERYREVLARDGIDLVLIPTAGSVENARLLEEERAEAALLQGGVEAAGGIETLGAVFTEPLLIFVRADGLAVPTNVARWRGLRIAAGAPGSGTRAAAESFRAAAGLPEDGNAFLPLSGADAAAAILAGDVDAALFVAPLSAPYLADVLADPRVTLLQIDHLVALSRRMPQSVIVDVPSGAFDLDPPLPARDRRLLGLVARLAAVEGLHPAAVDRLVMAAFEIHGPGDVITEAGRFPSMEPASLPQDSYARDLIADGPSALGRFLPYWIVAQISRVAILLLPIVFLLLPLLRVLPGLYALGIRRRVFTHYARIREIDDEAGRTSDADRLERLRSDLDSIDHQIAELNLPLAYRDYAYDARMHIDLLQTRIDAKRSRPS